MTVPSNAHVVFVLVFLGFVLVFVWAHWSKRRSP
jgi:hypothetical protein